MSPRNRLASWVGFALLIAVCCAPVHAFGETQLGIDPASLTPGERGVMRTVLQGTEIVVVSVRFVGYFENYAGPGHDLYLVELEGEVGEHIGVAAGMSGSPVYFRDRLIGALSYSIGFFPKDALAGVTPIEDMLDARRAAVPPLVQDSDRGPVRRIDTPISVVGMHPEVRAWIDRRWREAGLRVVAGGGGLGSPGGAAVRESTGTASTSVAESASSSNSRIASGSQGSGSSTAAYRLEPGSPVGVGLMSGDMNISATGTVTWIDHENVFAFGHPFLGRGRVELPLLSASVLHTLADQSGSFKLTETGSAIGRVEEDRLSAVVGSTSARARLFPLSVDVHGAAYESKTFRFEVVRNSTLAPVLVAAGVANAIASNLGFDRRTGARLRGVVRFKGLPDLPFETAVSGGVPPSPSNAIANHVAELLEAISQNRFGPVEIESVEVDLEMIDGERLYTVRSLNYDRGALRPGQRLQVQCVLESYRGETSTHRFDVRIPMGLPDDSRLVLAIGPPDQIQVALGRPLARRIQTAPSAASMIEAMGELRSSHRLRATLYRVRGGIVADGEALDELPPSALHLLGALKSATGNRPGLTVPISTQEIELDGPVRGGLQVRLRIDSNLAQEEEPR